MLTHDLVIATMNRPDDLRRCLSSVAAQDVVPARVRIVDASDDDRVKAVVTEADTGALSGRLVYRWAPPSTTQQRNEGVSDSGADVVHFVDDDVELEPGYFAAVMAEFEADTGNEVGGVGGLITNLPAHRPTLFKRIMLLDSKREGALLASGRNVLLYSTTEVVDVDWLSGCSMSFRRPLLVAAPFDAAGTGYVLGEDIDVSARIRRCHRLVVTPDARLAHLESPRHRLARAAWTRRELVARHARVRANSGPMGAVAFWWSVAGQAVGYLLNGWGAGDADDRQRFRSTLAGARSIAWNSSRNRCS